VALSLVLSACQGIAPAGTAGSAVNGSGLISATATPTPTSTPAVLDVVPARDLRAAAIAGGR